MRDWRTTLKTMGPAKGDLALAQQVVRRLLEANVDTLRRVVMIGSRRYGCARPDSDLDLVLIVEIPLAEVAAMRREMAAQNRRVSAALGNWPLILDISVRTIDQFEEARTVVGGVEWLAEHEGYVIYARSGDRAPIVRCQPDAVKRALVRTWLEDSRKALDRAVAMRNGTANHPDRLKTPDAFAMKSIRCAVYSVFVLHQVQAPKHRTLDEALEHLALHAPDICEDITTSISLHGDPFAAAYAVLQGVTTSLISASPDMKRELEPLHQRLRKPLILF